MVRRPRLLTIGGSDSGGGAGIQADLKTFAAFGGYGMSAITAVTAQNTERIWSMAEVPVQVVADQIDAVFDDLGVDALKTGMLVSAEIVAVVAERLAARPPTPMVLDPVMIAKSGDRLLTDDAVALLCERLLPRATVVTPNLPEAERLTGMPVGTEPQRVRAARELVRAGASAALIKGGHGRDGQGVDGQGSDGQDGDDPVVDLLYDGERVHRWARPRVTTRSDHGTGCTLAAAIAAGLGAGRELAVAVEQAGDYLHGALRHGLSLGRGRGPVDHFYRRP